MIRNNFLLRFARRLSWCFAAPPDPPALLLAGPEQPAPTLVVYAPEWTGEGSIYRLAGLLGIQAGDRPVAGPLPELGPCDLLAFRYSLCPISNQNPYALADRLMRAVDAQVRARQAEGAPYGKIVLVGYSVGSLLLRKALVWGLESLEDHPHPTAVPTTMWGWARDGQGRVAPLLDRLVLVAGMNRGWSLKPKPRHMRWSEYPIYRLVAALGRLRMIGRFMMALERGSPFVVDLRLQWLRTGARTGLPLTVQVLGDRDDLVSQEDTDDAEVMGRFALIQVPGTRHYEALRLNDARHGAGRAEALRLALALPGLELLRRYARPAMARGAGGPRPKAIVLIAHGIRSRRDWGLRLAQGLASRTVHVGNRGYGHLSVLGFLLFPVRRRFVRWLADEYTQCLLAVLRSQEDTASPPPSPAAPIPVHFIGHSNGTWLLARAMKDYRTLDFAHVALCQSPVARDFPWDRFVQAGRLGRLRNERAAGDMVIGLGAAAYRQLTAPLGLAADVGEGGLRGFDRPPASSYRDIHYVEGGHSAGTLPANDAHLLAFVQGEPEPPHAPPLRGQPAAWLQWLPNIIWLPVLLLVGLAVLLLASAYAWLGLVPVAAIVLLALLLAACF